MRAKIFSVMDSRLLGMWVLRFGGSRNPYQSGKVHDGAKIGRATAESGIGHRMVLGQKRGIDGDQPLHPVNPDGCGCPVRLDDEDVLGMLRTMFRQSKQSSDIDDRDNVTSKGGEAGEAERQAWNTGYRVKGRHLAPRAQPRQKSLLPKGETEHFLSH